jgi:hypothetical protein
VVSSASGLEKIKVDLLPLRLFCGSGRHVDKVLLNQRIAEKVEIVKRNAELITVR